MKNSFFFFLILTSISALSQKINIIPQPVAFNLRSSVLPSADHNGVLWKLESNNVDDKIIYVKGESTNASFNYSNPVLINSSGTYGAAATGSNNKIFSVWTWKTFSFNKATGKDITLKNEPAPNYKGSGAFTLVNGIITDKGLSEPLEWLGFAGTNLEADIDLGESMKIKNVSLDVLDDNDSWIYLPKEIQVATSFNSSTSTQSNPSPSLLPGPGMSIFR